MNRDPSGLNALALKFRVLMDQCEAKRLPISLSAFPVGACEDASLLLAEYLRERGYQETECVIGHRGATSHAWLETFGVRIDITVDQFDDEDRPRTFVTETHPWYSQWIEVERYAANWRVYDDYTQHTLLRAYRLITKLA